MNGSQSTRPRGASAPEVRTSGTGGRRKNTLGLTALVVDDNPAMLKQTAGMLEDLGYCVYTAAEGSEALFHFQSSPCELLLTGYEMPAINGFQLGRKVKFQFPGTRVVIMTGLRRAAVAGLMSDKGIDGWLFKPFYLEELNALLSQVGLPCGTSVESRSIV